ncbi:BREX-2 system adenine-specific DNA-methyltransferase PglX [Pseudarthrobacter sp. R1]|nr:BREX-2 system adenine-specific DNA-methyltransferase PglX [Pseudarthrobacter sp. R1]
MGRFEVDLLERLEGPLSGDIKVQWQAEHAEAVRLERTGQSWSEFSGDRITQAAVAWVLTSVFVRFCEDNQLLAPVWFTGPGARADEAVARQGDFIRTEAAVNPDVTVREWILGSIEYLQKTPATAGLVDTYSPLWLISPSADACAELIAFWRATLPDGGRVWDFADKDLSTRFLGDLYQDLSESAKKKYALLQTPEFVEEFILDRTLTPALRQTKASEIRVIDPTCGSGHFLLGAFARVLDELYIEAPAMTTSGRVQLALDAVRGVDLNPFAAAIARFRLLVAAMKEAGNHNLDNDATSFRIMVAVGDSLLHGETAGTKRALSNDLFSLEVVTEHQEFVFADENKALLDEILRIGYYDVVVGNPPYIQVGDKALNRRYRSIYGTCYRKYALSAPFMERFFQLAKPGENAGHVGQITSNSFMKREFGTKLIEEFLATKVDLTEVIDSEGAYIPGHNVSGTPTVIMVGRNRKPGLTPIRTVMSKGKREPTSGTPGTGPYWMSLAVNIDAPGHEDEWTSIVDLNRKQLAFHPWSMAGGGADEVDEALSKAASSLLGASVRRIGFFGIQGSDDAFTRPVNYAARKGLERTYYRDLILGDEVRDFALYPSHEVWFPYDKFHAVLSLVNHAVVRDLQPYKSLLQQRPTFSGSSYSESGQSWTTWHQLPKDIDASKLAISFAFISTHNHFVLDREGKVFNRSAPVIKLPANAMDDHHFELLGVLNSAAACFWLKHKSQPKGGAADVDFLRTYEFTGTTLQDFPLPSRRPVEPVRSIDALAQELSRFAPSAALTADGYASRREALDSFAKQETSIRGRMIALQEELDWQVYQSYALTSAELTYTGEVPEITLGERAFEIALARKIAAGDATSEWFTRHGSTPVTEIPEYWPAEYRDLVQQRLDLIEADRNINLLERPEYKRRWATESWDKRQAAAIAEWLLDRVEDSQYWFDHGTPVTRTVAGLADLVARDPEFLEVLELHTGTKDPDVTAALTKLLTPEAVPYLAAYRYKPSGLRKRADWEHTWELQRREDAGTYTPPPAGTDAPISVPPKYKAEDFAQPHYWTNRGKLDVPKERFILYPDAGPAHDPTPVFGWAGWDHAQQALALATLLQTAEDDGQPDNKLIPLAAGLEELEPWLHQWHTDIDPAYSASPAAFFTPILDEYTTKLGLTRQQLHTWKPTPATSRARTKKATP